MSHTIQCISPIDGRVYAERPLLSKEAAINIIEKAKIAQVAWSKRPIEERMNIVLSGIMALGEMNDEVVPELAWQMGRPIRYGGEFSGVKARTDAMIQIAKEALADNVIEESDQYSRFIRRQPHGLVFVLAPWNYPYMTAINTIVPALIAGNAVLLKHASQTLLVGERLVKALHSGGVPQDLLHNVFLDHPTTSQLISQRQFDFINFTGSVQGGQTIEKSAAGTFTSLGLELGGKDPAYVMEDADLDKTVDSVIDGAMFNSGQCCCGIERIYVAEKLYDSFVDKALSIVSNYQLGNPLDEATTLGPMAHERFALTVREQIADALNKGAKALLEPFPQDDGKAYLSPQILTHVNHDMSVMQEESFGPVVGIMKVKNDAQAIALLNDSSFGLTASLWSEDAHRALSIANEIETGTAYLNRCDYIDPYLCWTGIKETGRGGALSTIGYHNLTRPKSYHLKKQ